MLGRRAPRDPFNAPDPPPARHRHRAAGTRRPVSATALWPSAALVLVVLLGLRALQQAARPGEGLLSAEAFLRTATRGEPSAGVLSPDGLAALHMAVYAAVTRAFDRADTLVAAGRELLLVVAVVSAVLLWATARRLGFGSAGTAVAMLLAGVPALLSPVGLLDVPAQLAVPWLLLAALLSAGGRPSRTGLGIALLSTVLAVLLAPDVLVLLLTGGAAALATGVLQPRGTGPARMIAAALLGAAAVGVALLLADPEPGAATFGVAPGALRTAALVFVVIGSLAIAVVGRLRVPALALVATSLLTLLPSGRISALVICLPVAALLSAGLARALMRPRAETTRLLLRTAGVTALAGATLATVVVLPGSPAPSADRRNPAAAVVEWAGSGLSPETRLIADSPLRAQLIHAGADQGAVRPPGARPDEPQATVLSVVRGEPPDGALVLARFTGAGAAGPLLVVDPVPRIPTGAELSRRRSLAAALLDNPATSPGERAAEVLRSGEVDPRLLSVLAALGAQFGVGVQDFPLADGEPGEGPLARRALVDRIAGDPLLPGTPATERLVAWLEAQLPPFAADSVVATERGVRIEFAYVSDPDALVSSSTP